MPRGRPGWTVTFAVGDTFRDRGARARGGGSHRVWERGEEHAVHTRAVVELHVRGGSIVLKTFETENDVLWEATVVRVRFS